MADIGFYHLTRTTADAALPPLLGRTLAAGQRAVIRLTSADHLAALDRALWLSTDPDWLPHGADHPTLQPIYLTLADENPNNAAFLFLLGGADSAALATYTRVFDLFDGTDPVSVTAARTRWTARKAANHTLTYWQQGPTGWTKGP
jgi:DNA polymerase-3 subunit chi